MSTWVLIISITYGSSSPPVAIGGYSTEQACAEAGAVFIKQAPRNINQWFACLPGPTRAAYPM